MYLTTIYSIPSPITTGIEGGVRMMMVILGTEADKGVRMQEASMWEDGIALYVLGVHVFFFVLLAF